MTAATGASTAERSDVRTIVGSGVGLGVVTALGVTVFALVSRPLQAGTTETIVQAVLILLGGAVFAYAPASRIRPRSADAIAWAALVGLLGALSFTVLDTAVLRPMKLYHWSWDQIGGGSGFWYIPVWWMGSAFLAWLGAMVASAAAANDASAGVVARAIQTIGISVVLFAILAATVAPFHSATMALAFTLSLALHAVLSAALTRR